MKKIKYGQVVQTESINERTKKTVKSIFQAGDETIRFVSYEEKIKVKDENEELAQYLRFRKEHPDRQGVATRIEQPLRMKDEGSYVLVVCWEEQA